MRHFPVEDHKHAVNCYRNGGPKFGFGELSAGTEPFDKDNCCSSWTHKTGFNIPESTEGVNELTQIVGGYFTIDELEVWEVLNI